MAVELQYHKIDWNQAPCFIAEIGLNHNGNLQLAKDCVDAAQKSGAQVVKFQLFDSDAFINPKALLSEQTGEKLSDFFRKFELTKPQWRELADHCQRQKIDFICSVFDKPSLEFYKTLPVRAIKISSCDLTNTMLINDIKSLLPDLSVLISTGTCDESEIEAFTIDHNLKDLVLLQCVSSYPANSSDYNLNTIPSWKKKFNLLTGLSDHTTSNDLAIAATAMGTCVIEKHFTLDKSMEGPDQKLSLNPIEFADMTRRCLEIYEALGDGHKRCTDTELNTRKYGRRGIYLSRNLAKGSLLNKDDLIAQRPGGTDFQCADLESIVQKTITNDLHAHAPLKSFDIDNQHE